MQMKYIQSIVFSLSAVLSAGAQAIPSLQLSGGGSGDWIYDDTETWVYTGASSFDLYTYANAIKDLGGNGDFAWDAPGADDRYAYLTVAAVPDLGTADAFDLIVNGATLVESGYGKPPIEDSNSISPHAIFDTYFEIYEFQFDGPVGTIHDQQPGGTGSGAGYTEVLSIEISSLLPDITGLHFDLFTVAGDGRYLANGVNNKNLVSAVAPYSHDAEWSVSEPDESGVTSNVPEPGILMLLVAGLAGFGIAGRWRPRG